MEFIFLGLIFAQWICSIAMIHAWVVPPANFINEFAIQHQLTSITIYLPTNMADPWVSWYRKYFSKYVLFFITYLKILMLPLHLGIPRKKIVGSDF